MSAQKVLDKIANEIGFQPAHSLALARAGTTFYVPQDPPPHHWLHDLMDAKAVEALCRKFGGDRILLPQLRDQAAHRIQVALRNGLQVRQIALITGVSERRVHAIKADLVESGRLPGDAA
ncbi:hypothetical protein [Thioalkalivibrio sp. ALMg9]|uniref:hypothetical protein n=1 Tax=Thioalkalivibrio sp. ALMg9 TaxID=1266912 RepID=UPI00035FAD56|nr:hypothetical protein [Thioalkalivibrio sp. ALMg9]